MVHSYGFPFDRTTVGQASGSMTNITENFHWWVSAWCLYLVFFKPDVFAKAYRIRFHNYGNVSWYAVLFGNANEMIDILPG